MEKVNPSSKKSDSTIQNKADEFLELKKMEGYAQAALYYYASAIKAFTFKIGATKKFLTRKEIEKAIRELRNEKVLSRETYLVFIWEGFVNFLSEDGFAEEAPIIEKNATLDSNALQRETLAEEFKSYLINNRGLKGKTITHGVRWLDRFLNHRFGNEFPDISCLTTYDVYDFIGHLHGTNKACRDKSIPSHLRNVFRYFHWAGLNSKDIANSVPSAKIQKNNIPRFLPSEQVNRLVNAALESPSAPLRNYAIMLVLARLGLRSQEVAKIQLEDLKWASGNIVIRGKGDLIDEVPMTNEIGTAIVNYLQNERRGSSRALFVTSKPPFKSLKNGGSLRRILVDCYERTNINPPQRYIGTHILRHSLATEMLAKGANLSQISQLLRHKSRDTTTIYAKYDIDALRELAKPWPGTAKPT